MSGYYNFTSGDIITMLIFGLLFFMASYGVPLGVYFWGNKKLENKQISQSTVIIIAFLSQVGALIAVFLAIFILDLQTNLNSLSTVSFSESVASFFAVDWANLNVSPIASYYFNANKLGSEIGLYLLLKTIWIVLNMALFAFPFFLLYKSVYSLFIKYKDMTTGAFYEIAQDFFSMVLGTFMLFGIHTQIPNIFLDSFYNSNSSSINSKAGSSNTRGYYYHQMSGEYVKKSLESIK